MFKGFFSKLFGSHSNASFMANNPDFPQQTQAAVLMAQTGIPIQDPRDAAVKQYLSSSGGRI